MDNFLSPDIVLTRDQYPWVYKLGKYEEHPILSLIEEFGSDSKALIESSYLYIGELPSSAHSTKKRRVVVWHYHTSLKSPIRFGEMQNLKSYAKFSGLQDKEQNKLAMDIDYSSVIDLRYPDALTSKMLDEIEMAKKFFLCDELGNAKEFYWNI